MSPLTVDSHDLESARGITRRGLLAAAGVVAGGACLTVAIAATGCALGGAGTAGERGGTSGAGDGDGADGASWEPICDLGDGWTRCGSLDLRFAQNFSVDYYTAGPEGAASTGGAGSEGSVGPAVSDDSAEPADPYVLVCVSDGSAFLVVPEGREVPDGLASGIQVIERPVRDVYLVASNVLCLVDALGEVPSVALVGIAQKDCTVEAFSRALERGDVLYGGKYNAPDYELIADAGCRLAIENTMVNHDPSVKQKLRDLGLSVLVDQSSNEPHAMGRLEWIKLYGELWGKADLAGRLFDAEAAIVEDVADQIASEAAGERAKTVAFFYINANGSAVTRRKGDFVAQMIEMAGGAYVFDDARGEEGSTSTVTLEMERFYAVAKDADCIVYNATIDDSVRSMADLLAKNPLIADFKAVRTGDAWCTERNLYQQMTATGQIVRDIHTALTDPSVDALDFMFRLV